MGQRHREKRKLIKARLRQVQGQLINLDDHRKFEDEFGELRTRMTKAEARSRLLFRRTIRIESLEELLALKNEFGELYDEIAERDIINALSEEIKLDIDRQVFAEIDHAIAGTSVSL
jgi:ribosomal protein L9